MTGTDMRHVFKHVMGIILESLKWLKGNRLGNIDINVTCYADDELIWTWSAAVSQRNKKVQDGNTMSRSCEGDRAMSIYT